MAGNTHTLSGIQMQRNVGNCLIFHSGISV
jgi:hypothetical protein